ncbi:MAG: SMP-30/gluconolactonase/LRE family protein, partial [Phycisphaerales bacterium]|nr:SMP-30/gluconolactonase/LRE family protein [Phycisphaerales bacterium]
MRACTSMLLITMPLACAFAQSGPNGFAPGSVFLTETGAEGCRAQRSWIREFDPLTGESWLIADYFDGLCGNSGLAFTPDGSQLRVINLTSDDILDFDSAGNGVIVYDYRVGLNGPFGGNGLVWDRDGNFFVANEYSQQILRFSPAGGRPTVLADQNDGITGGGGLAVLSNGDLLFANNRLLRISPGGVVSVFDPYFAPTFPRARTIARSKDGIVYVGALLNEAPPGKIYRYTHENPASRELILEGFSSYNWMSIALSEDESVLYVVDNWSLYSVDLTT